MAVLLSGRGGLVIRQAVGGRGDDCVVCAGRVGRLVVPVAAVVLVGRFRDRVVVGPHLLAQLLRQLALRDWLVGEVVGPVLQADGPHLLVVVLRAGLGLGDPVLAQSLV